MKKISGLKMLFGPYFSAAFFPILVFVNEAFGTGLWNWFALLVVLSALEMALGMFFGSRRLLPGMVLAAGAVALCIGFSPLGAGTFIVCACLAVSALYTLMLSTRSWEELSSAKYTIPALVINLIVACFMTLSGRHDQVLLGYVAIPFLFAAFFLINRRMLTASASMQRGLSPRIVQQNTLILVVLCAVLLVFVNLSALSDLIQTAIAWLVSGILRLIGRFGGSGDDGGGSGGEPGGSMDFSGLPAAESSRFWEVLTVIVQYIVLLAVIVGIGFGLYFGIRRLSRFLSRTLRKFVGAYQDGFEDESQTLKTAQQMREEITNFASERLKKFLTPTPNWDKLTSAQKVRYAYRRARERAKDVGIDPDPLTPHELLTHRQLRLDGEREVFEQTYYETRYRETEPNEKELDNARAVAQTKRK